MGFLRKVFKKAGKGIKRAIQGIGDMFKEVNPKVLVATLALNLLLPGVGSAMAGTLQSAGLSSTAAQVGSQVLTGAAKTAAVGKVAGEDVSAEEALLGGAMSAGLSGINGGIQGPEQELSKALETSQEILDSPQNKGKVFMASEMSKNIEDLGKAATSKQPVVSATDQELIAEATQTEIGADVTKKGAMILPDTEETIIEAPTKTGEFTLKGQDEKFYISDFKSASQVEEFATANNLQINFNKENTGPNLNNPFVLNNKGEAKKIGFFADSNYKLEDGTVNPSYGKINWNNAKDAAFETTGEFALDYGLSQYLAEDYSGPVGATGFISPEAPQEAPQAAVLDNMAKPYLNAGYQGPVGFKTMASSPYFGPGTIDYQAANRIEIPVPNVPIPS